MPTDKITPTVDAPAATAAELQTATTYIWPRTAHEMSTALLKNFGVNRSRKASEPAPAPVKSFTASDFDYAAGDSPLPPDHLARRDAPSSDAGCEVSDETIQPTWRVIAP